MEVSAATAATDAVNFGIWHMFWQAGLVVKIVMLGLVAASVWCWAIVFEKFASFKKIDRSMDQFEQQFWSGQSLEDLYAVMSPRNNTGMAALFMAAMREWKRSQESVMRAGFAGVQTRIDRVLDLARWLKPISRPWHHPSQR